MTYNNIMVNDCTNIVTITCQNAEMLDTFIDNELEELREYNKKYHEIIKIYKRGKLGIVFKLWSAWSPDVRWFETILEKYPEFWIKIEWNEDGGMAGVWVGHMKNDNEKAIESLSWRDLSIEEEDYFFSAK